MNVGHTNNEIERSVFYDKIYQALKKICRHTDANSCSGETDITVEAESSTMTPVLTCAPQKLTVRIESAVWNGNPKVFFLLVGAVAGAFQRATWPEESCDEYQLYNKHKQIKPHRHCNTAKYANAYFPNGQQMKVSLHNPGLESSKLVDFDCFKAREQVADELYRLQEEIEEAVVDGDSWVNVECMV